MIYLYELIPEPEITKGMGIIINSWNERKKYADKCIVRKEKNTSVIQLTDSCREVQSICINDVDVRSSRICEQYGAYPLDHTSCLATHSSKKYETDLKQF